MSLWHSSPRRNKSWITGIHNILSIFDENYTGHLPSKINISNIKSYIKDEFKKFWKKQITSHHGKSGGNKLRTYSKFKCQFSQESYVTQILFLRRANYTKFRISAHTLAIETGRHTRPVTPCYVAVCNNYAICNKLQTALNCNAVCNTLQTAFRVLKNADKTHM